MSYSHEGRQYIAVALSEREHPAELVVLALPSAGDGGAAASSPRQEASTVEQDTAARVSGAPEQLAAGQRLYSEHCADCHGHDGNGTQASNTPPLDRLGSLADVRQVVIDGAPEMPALGAVLTSEEIDAVTRYVLVELRSP